MTCCFSAILFADDDEEAKETFYSQTKRCIVRLEHSIKYLEEGSKEPKNKTISDGTAFFVKYKNILYVVTARHVVEKDHDLHARVPVVYKPKDKDETLGAEEREEIILLKLPRDGWIHHIDKGTDDRRCVDVAVMKIYPAKDRGIIHFLYLDKEGPEYNKKNQLPEKDAMPPTEVMIFGFPLDIGFELEEQRPLGRRGMVSFASDEKFIKDATGKYFDERCFIMDIESFPGNSGSPVINTPSPFKNKIELFGVVIASNERQDFSIAEPVSRIREVLETADKDKREPYRVWHRYTPDKAQ